mgnify:CR=1
MPSGFLGGTSGQSAMISARQPLPQMIYAAVALRGSLIPREWRPILRKLYITSRRF